MAGSLAAWLPNTNAGLAASAGLAGREKPPEGLGGSASFGAFAFDASELG